MSIFVFYDYTPIELHYALKAYNEREEEQLKSDWERTRLSMYFSYVLTPSKRSKVSFDKFKTDYFPMYFDKPREATQVVTDEVFESMIDILKDM